MAINNFIDRIKIGNSEGEIAIGSSAYGICNTQADVAGKTVSIPGFALNEGTTIHVKFAYANTAEDPPTLNVNNTGAKSIVLYGDTDAGTNEYSTGWQAGAILTLTYDGTNWVRNAAFNELISSSNIGNNLNPVYVNNGSMTASIGNTIPFIVGTGTSAGTWTGTLAGLTEYYDGLMILYKSPVAGGSTTTLNLNNIGAKTCYLNSNTKLTTHFPANQPILLIYCTSLNGGCWTVSDYNSDSNTYTAAHCATAASTVAKAASCTYWAATSNSYIHINFRYTNTANNPTLNINSTGAKPIYVNGERPTSSNTEGHELKAGSYIAFYDGTNYQFRTDGKLPGLGTIGSAESVPLAGVTDATNLQTIEALTGTSGLLKKTAENTWTLDTNSYVTSSGITSVTIGATSPVQSSTSTAQTGSSASTTISLKDAYGDTKNPYGTKAKNLVLAGPSSGNNTAPTFRALVAADIPNSILKWQTTTAESTALYDFGIYVNQNNANGSGMKGSNYFSILNVPYRKASGNTKADWGWQLGNITANDGRLWYRTSGDNVWGDWQTIAHATQSTSDIGSTTQPVYMTAAGVITAGTALKDLAYISKGTGNTKFLREDGTWQTALTAHQTYTAFTGKPTTNQTPDFGSTFTIQQISQSTSGQVSGTDRTVKIPDTAASISAVGLVDTSAQSFAGIKTFYDHYTNGHIASTTTTAGQYAVIRCTNKGAWMTSFHVRMYTGYDSYTLEISGYNYSTNNWYSPKAIMVASTSTSKVTVTFGYDNDATNYKTLWVAIPIGNYPGIDVQSVVTGYMDTQPRFSVTIESGVPATAQTTVDAYRPWYRNETVSNATTATNLSAKPSLAASGNNITITAGGKTSDAFTVPYATSADSAKYLYPFNDGTNVSSTTNIQILQTIQNNDDTPRSVPFGVKLQHGNTEVGFGYFYPKTALYGGWYIASYGGPSYVAVTNGTWETYKILTSKNTAASTNNAATLAWNTTYTIAKINDVDIKFTTMAKPSYAFTDLTAHPTTLSGYGITDAKIVSGVITLGSNTITPVTSVNGHTGSSVSVTASDLGLSNALHFIGQATQTITNGGTQHPTIANETYDGTDGDVVIDNNALREYVWSDGAWLLLGYTSSQIYAQPSTDPATNQWISKITQNTDGTISATLGTLDTSGTWSGTASNVSTTANTSSTLYLVGVTSSTAQGLKRSNITIKGSNFTAGNWQASTINILYGGTGATSVNKYGILYGNSNQDAYASTSTGDAGLVIIGGGTSAAPNWYEGLTLSGAGTVASPYLATFGGDISIGGGLTLGDSTNWGDEYTPIYWNNGVPGKVTTILRESFTLGTSTMSSAGTVTTTITNNTSANSRVVQIVVTDGFSNLHSVIEWQLNSSNQIQLSATTQKVVSGYILYIK